MKQACACQNGSAHPAPGYSGVAIETLQSIPPSDLGTLANRRHGGRRSKRLGTAGRESVAGSFRRSAGLKLMKESRPVSSRLHEWAIGGKDLQMRAIFIVLLCGLPATVFAHYAPSGWEYPSSCCSNLDCREVGQTAISERPQGYTVEATGEVVPYNDKRLRISPDGEYHWCSAGGKDYGKTICLFVPPRAY